MSAEPAPVTDHGYTGAPPRPVAPLDNPDDAARARSLVAAGRTAALATLDAAAEPYVSVVQYVCDAAGNPVLYLSELAAHTRNARGNARASLMVAAVARAQDDPMALPRATLQGRIEHLGRPAELIDRLVRRHPTVAPYVDFGDFACWRVTVHTVRYIGGYGRMSWVDAPAYASAAIDPLAEAAEGVIAHMNDDHADACLTYVQVFGGAPEATGARLVGVDRLGMDLLADCAGSLQPVRVNFAAPCESTAEVRAAVVALLADARARP